MAGGAVNAAIFAAGALLGGGIATVVANKRREGTAPASTLPTRPVQQAQIVPAPPQPVVQVDRTSGSAKFASTDALGREVVPVQGSFPPVLKGGHPGE